MTSETRSETGQVCKKREETVPRPVVMITAVKPKITQGKAKREAGVTDIHTQTDSDPVVVSSFYGSCCLDMSF